MSTSGHHYHPPDTGLWTSSSGWLRHRGRHTSTMVQVLLLLPLVQRAFLVKATHCQFISGSFNAALATKFKEVDKALVSKDSPAPAAGTISVMLPVADAVVSDDLMEADPSQPAATSNTLDHNSNVHADSTRVPTAMWAALTETVPHTYVEGANAEAHHPDNTYDAFTSLTAAGSNDEPAPTHCNSSGFVVLIISPVVDGRPKLHKMIHKEAIQNALNTTILTRYIIWTHNVNQQRSRPNYIGEATYLCYISLLTMRNGYPCKLFN